MTREEAKELAPKMVEACYSVDYDNRMELYIDGDEKFIDQIYDEYEAQIAQIKAEAEHDQRNSAMSQKESLLLLEQLQAKEEEIESLKNQYKKARKIVAVLFWGWREYKRRGKSWEYEAKAYEQSFNEAYSMLKGE